MEKLLLTVRFICIGRIREKYHIDELAEYSKRLSAFCRFECVEISEMRLPANPSYNDINYALEKEADSIVKYIPHKSYCTALCIEGKKISSIELSNLILERENSGKPDMCFIIGGSNGLSKRIKSLSDFCLSMSDMTFPHFMARIMLAEQVYRAFTIITGSPYHK